jgi:hypothetical protein
MIAALHSIELAYKKQHEVRSVAEVSYIDDLPRAPRKMEIGYGGSDLNRWNLLCFHGISSLPEDRRRQQLLIKPLGSLSSAITLRDFFRKFKRRQTVRWMDPVHPAAIP